MSTSEFSYIPESPEQTKFNNKGIFSPTDIYNLNSDNKWTQFGQLELIETNDISSTSSLLLENLKDFKIHFLTYNNVGVDTDAQAPYIRFYESGVLEDASVYQHANVEGRASGSFFEVRSTGFSAIRLTGNAGNQTNEKENGYVYFYGLGDNTKYSFTTNHNSNYNRDPATTFNYGSQMLPQASSVDKILFYVPSGTFSSGVVSLYGVEEDL